MLRLVRPKGKRRGKRLLFVNPPIEEPGWRRRDEDLVRRRVYTFPQPIGLLRVAGQLLREGNEILFLDCFSSLPRAYPSSKERSTPSAKPEVRRTGSMTVGWTHLGLTYDHLRSMLRNVTADEVYVGCTFTYHHETAHETIAICREELPNAHIRFGGIYPTLAPDHAAQSQADEVFRGKYPGIEDEALNYDFLGRPPGFILVKGTSGCPHNCAYCAVHILEGRQFTHRDPEDVFREIEAAHRRYGIRHVAIWDSNVLTRYPDYLGVVLDRLIASGVPFTMAAPEGLDYRLMTDKIARQLKRAGLKSVSLALENVDDELTKKQLNRANSIPRLTQSIAALKSAGFDNAQIRLFVMIGLPGQSLDNVIRSIHYVWNLGCNVVLFPFTPIPGTRIFAEHLPELRDRPLSALHPSLFPCVKDDRDTDIYYELMPLNGMAAAGVVQSERFAEYVEDPAVVEMLAG